MQPVERQLSTSGGLGWHTVLVLITMLMMMCALSVEANCNGINRNILEDLKINAENVMFAATELKRYVSEDGQRVPELIIPMLEARSGHYINISPRVNTQRRRSQLCRVLAAHFRSVRVAAILFQWALSFSRTIASEQPCYNFAADGDPKIQTVLNRLANANATLYNLVRYRPTLIHNLKGEAEVLRQSSLTEVPTSHCGSHYYPSLYQLAIDLSSTCVQMLQHYTDLYDRFIRS